jgi:predicted transcriptional regulator of viral defense system
VQRLTGIALEKTVNGVFSRAEIACWIGGSQDRQWSLVKRSIAAGEIVRIRRGLYCLSSKYLRRKIDPVVLAQRIYGPSYISLESALSYHGWIPEAVYTVTSVSLNRSREFSTPVGRFSFTCVPQKTFYAEVSRVEKDEGSFLLASPLKALADYVYVHKRDWDSARPVIESLRVEQDDLAGVDASSFERLSENYSGKRARRFLENLRKDVIK